jgi:GT2 family glycosyltransferase
MPDLTVVITAFGRAPVDRAVASVVDSAATGAIDAEILVVWQTLREAPPSIPGATVLPVHDVNLSYARNRGADEADAPLIAYLDDDEMADPGWLAAAVQALGDADAAFGPVQALDAEGRPHCEIEVGPPRVFEGYIAPWLVGTGGSMAFRRDALAKVGGFDLRLGTGSVGLSADEADLIWRLLMAGSRIRFSPEMVVYHPTKTDAEILASRYPYGFGTGKLLRRARSARLTANSAHAIAHSNVRALLSRDRQQRREAWAFGRGVLEGFVRRSRWYAPDLGREPVPPAVKEALNGRTPTPLPVGRDARPHYVWSCGGAILHALVGPTEQQLEAPEARRWIGELPGVTGIPRVLAQGRSRDVLWVLEERVHGKAVDPVHPEQWWPAAAEWVARYARHAGDAYGATDAWRLGRAEWAAEAPDGWQEEAAASLERAAAQPSGPSHGALRPKNVILSPGGVSAIDWDWASATGVRGEDLVLLAARHAGEVPDEAVLRALAQNRNPPFGDVLGPLAALGLEGQALRDTLLLLVLKWAHFERDRQLGGQRQRPAFGPMARRVVPALLEGVSLARAAP